MSKKLVSSAFALALVAAPLSASAGMGADETFNIYGWQNWSYEFVDIDESREFDRLSNNAANIGFSAHVDTGIDGLQAGFRCEQFTYFGRNNIYTDWCNRNSKISLRHETMGEVMFAQWLLPYNEIVAQWVDPFYDAGADSHTSIMGNIGGAANNAGGWLSSLFYNGSFDDAFGSVYGALAFNRRQEGVIQYVWPNTSAMASQTRDGFQFRIAITEGSATDGGGGERPIDGGDFIHEVVVDDDNPDNLRIVIDSIRETENTVTVDPRIWSTGVSWQQNFANGGQVWLAVAYENHEDLSITDLSGDLAASCTDSDDEGLRFAGRYAHDWGNGQKTMIAAMYEELDYEANGCDDLDAPGDVQTKLDAGEDVTQAVWTDVERDAWMISGKHMFGNGLDFRFSYMDADEWDCGNDSACTSEQEKDTGAEAYNLGLFYTMPAGTELRLTYSEVDNEDNAGYDFGINGSNIGGPGRDVESIAIGIVQWFD